MEYTLTHIGHRIRKARENQGYSQADLAEKLGVQIDSIERWENEVTLPRANRLNTLSGILNVPLLWLMAGSDSIPDSMNGQSNQELINEKLHQAEQHMAELSVLLNDIRILAQNTEEHRQAA